MRDDPLAIEILRESIRSRAGQALPGVLALYAVLVVLTLLLMGQAPAWKLLAWFGPLAVAMAARLAYATRLLKGLDSASAAQLHRLDAWLRYSSMANQFLCGAGIWIVAGGASDLVAFFITLAIALFGVGAMINLISDYRSFRVSLPLLMAHPIAFWLLAGLDGLRIALPLALLTLLMLSLVRASARTMAESVRMRFEKSALLERVEQERAATAQALQVAKSAMRARAIFLASASHDLRQPLYAISLLADALDIEPLPEHAALVLARQREAIAVLGTLFDNLLDLSRFDAGEVRPNLRVVALPDVLLPLCSEFEVLCQSKGLSWEARIPQAWVRTDPELLRRLAANLLSNAVRYTASGAVTFVATAGPASVSVAVTDTGRGIAAEDRERVFDEFVQLDNPARDRDHGVGLGLSIVKHIAGLLDARLRMDSTLGRGTCVTFEVPVAEAPGVTARDTTERPPRFDRLKGLRLWVVEDDPLVREALATHLRAWGTRFEFAMDRESLLALRDREGAWPDAVVMDDMLGKGERGLEIAEWLRRFVPRERIVLVTGNVDPDRTRQLERSGFVVLAKPLASQDLAQWLGDAVAASPAD